jgi:transcriptional regulator with XRE-family HTH domain
MNPYAAIADKETLGLVVLAQTALGYTQQRLADALDTSLRTVQRWSSGDSHPTAGHIRTLAILVHPHDANLAGKLAARIDDTPESLGLVARPPPPTERAVTLTREVSTALAESVVAAAAEAMDASPRVARPVVVAAMQRARSAGLGVEDVISGLRPEAPRAAMHAKARKEGEGPARPKRATR